MLAQGNDRQMTGFRRYINIREGSGPVETIDEFDTMTEASRCLKEYRMSYQGTGYDCWLSRRPTNDWRQE